MKRYAFFTLVAFLLFFAASAAFAAQQADLNRWLEECMKIRGNPSLNADGRKAQYTEAANKGNIVVPIMLESGASGAEAARWAKVNQDNKIVTILREQASSDARAQALLGDIYEEGLAGVRVDAAQAFEWVRKAAEQNYALAQNYLGYMYANGIGVPKNEAQAVAFFLKAAEQGFFLAQGTIGYRYEHGNGLPVDKAKAMEWYRKAAAQGHQASINDLQRMQAAGRTTASSGSTSGGSGQRPAERKPTCQYCGKSGEYGRCVSAPTPGTSIMNKHGNHRYPNSGGNNCFWCGSTNRGTNCSFSNDGRHEF